MKSVKEGQRKTNELTLLLWFSPQAPLRSRTRWEFWPADPPDLTDNRQEDLAGRLDPTFTRDESVRSSAEFRSDKGSLSSGFYLLVTTFVFHKQMET